MRNNRGRRGGARTAGERIEGWKIEAGLGGVETRHYLGLAEKVGNVPDARQ